MYLYINQSGSNLWEEEKCWLTVVSSERVRRILGLAVDPLTENIFYITDCHR